MRMFELLIAAALVTGCEGREAAEHPDRVTELEAENAELQRALTGCEIDWDDARLAVEACLYELDDTERSRERCKGGN